MQREKRKVDSGDSEESEKFAMLPTVTYLENTINEEGDSLIDLIVNDNATLPDNSFNSSEELHKKMLSILNVLDSRERIIIEDYFGLSGNTKTLEDIGEDLDLTKERVRQIKEKALRKLRNESEFLFDYI
jgi:RNA polymerase primary sigma factor